MRSLLFSNGNSFIISSTRVSVRSRPRIRTQPPRSAVSTTCTAPVVTETSCCYCLRSSSHSSWRMSSTFTKFTKPLACRAVPVNYSCDITRRSDRSRSFPLQTISYSSFDKAVYLNQGYDNDVHQKLSTPDIHKFFTNLKSYVIFQDDNLLALNKPLGLSVYGGDANDINLKARLPQLAEELECGDLNIGISLKSYISGVTVLTKKKAAAKDLLKFLQSVNAQKKCFMTFLAVTVGIPQCRLNEDIKLVIQREFLHDREMSVVCEQELSKREQKALRNEGALIQVIYQVEVLVENKETQSALVQIKVNKYKWDACELFLSHFLSPILGDQIYSNRTLNVMGTPFPNPPQTAAPGPQRLPPKLSRALNHQKSNLNLDALPLFLHLHKITLTNFPKTLSPSFDITARPSEMFLMTLKRLGLYRKKIFSDELIP